MKVKFKRDGRIEKIPKGWAELNSSTKLQVRTTSKVKTPIGKVRDVDFRFGLGVKQEPAEVVDSTIQEVKEACDEVQPTVNCRLD